MLKNQYNKRSNNVNIMSLACCLLAQCRVEREKHRRKEKRSKTTTTTKNNIQHTTNLLAKTLIHTNKHTKIYRQWIRRTQRH